MLTKKVSHLWRENTNAEKPQLGESYSESLGNTFNDLLFIGFLLTISHTIIVKIFGEVWLVLLLPQVTITLGTLIWCIAINLYLSILWTSLYRVTQNKLYQFVSACYIFAIIELFITWDNPWFMLFGFIPMTSNTLIAFGFAYYYSIWKWRTV